MTKLNAKIYTIYIANFRSPSFGAYGYYKCNSVGEYSKKKLYESAKKFSDENDDMYLDDFLMERRIKFLWRTTYYDLIMDTKSLNVEELSKAFLKK